MFNNTYSRCNARTSSGSIELDLQHHTVDPYCSVEPVLRMEYKLLIMRTIHTSKSGLKLSHFYIPLHMTTNRYTKILTDKYYVIMESRALSHLNHRDMKICRLSE